MSVELNAYIIVFSLSFALTVLLVPVSDFLGKRLNIVSKAGGRRLNEGDYRRVSKFGGLALFGGFTITVIAAQFLNVPRFDSYEIIRLIGLLLGGTLIFVVGFIDDLVEFSAVQIGIGQILSAGIAIACLIFIETFNNPLSGLQIDILSPIVTITISMLWLGLMMNTVNFMDGLDGLASGIAFIGGAMLFVNSAFILEPAQQSVSLLPLALMGTSLGFLMFNFYPARIFMGGGAYFLGYVVGSLSIIGGAKMATILLVMGLPLMDLAWQATNRLLQGRNPMSGDRGHIHFRLLDQGYSQRQIVVTYYVFCSFFGVLTLLVDSQLFKFIALGALILLTALGFSLVARSGEAKPHAGSSKSS